MEAGAIAGTTSGDGGLEADAIAGTTSGDVGLEADAIAGTTSGEVWLEAGTIAGTTSGDVGLEAGAIAGTTSGEVGGAAISGRERVEFAHMLSKSGESSPDNGERPRSVPGTGESSGPRRTSPPYSEIGEYAYEGAFAPASGEGGRMDMLVMWVGAGKIPRESHCF